MNISGSEIWCEKGSGAMDFWSKPLRIVLVDINMGVLDLAARFGLENDEFVNPVISVDQARAYAEKGYGLIFVGGNDVWDRLTGESIPIRQGIWKKEGHILVEDEAAARYLAAGEASNRAEIAREKKAVTSLADLYSLEGFLGSMDYPFPDRTDIGFKIERDLGLEELSVLAGLAARFGFESTGMIFPLIADENRSLIHVCAGETGVSLLAGDLKISGSGDAFVELVKNLSEGIDPFWQEYNPRRVRVIPEGEADRVWEYTLPEEEIILWVKENLESLSSAKEVVVFVSEPVRVRERLSQELSRYVANVKVLPVYKTGFFWLEEVVKEEIPDSVVSLKIGFKVHNVGSRGRGFRDGLLDPAIRWLQEIYPIDELLDIPLEFEGRWSNGTPRYVVEGYDSSGDVVYRNSLSVTVKERPYLKRFPDKGSVLVTQGGVVADGVVKHTFPSKLERFWEIYERDVLPVLEGMVQENQEEVFSELVVSVSLREEEMLLPVRQERVSVLESLHEDIYFKTLDFFRLLGEERFGRALLSPGKILPEMKVIETGEAVRISLKKERTFEYSKSEDGFSVMSADEFLKRVHNEIIGPDELPLYLRFLMSLGIKVFNGGESEEGREIPVLVLSTLEGVKSSLRKPTVLIKARHHANEVSSTNTALWLAYLSVKDEEIKDIFERINVVLIPLENPDGAALHQKLNRENPGWSHHAARYNSRGYEFGYDYHKREKAKEAEVLARVYYRFLPDMIIDDHGVPSHEWVQFLSGYSAGPLFQSYWLPRAKVYGIMPFCSGSILGKYQLELMESIGRGIRKRYPEIYKGNKEWLEVYNRYANDWLPEEFTYQGVEGMIFYQWPAPIDSEGRQFSQRFPDVTFADWVTEVGDETAEGEYLKECIKAHLAVDLLALEYVARKENTVIDEAFAVGDYVLRRKRRIRFWKDRSNEDRS